MNDPFLPEELRLFIACELPDAWLEALRSVERELQRAGLPRLRWVRSEGIHLTLKFLGEVGRHLLPDLHTAMVDACDRQRPFSLRLAGLGSFGSRGRVRVLWAGLEGDLRALEMLQRRLDGELNRLGFARETRPFSPHLTLARVPDDAPADTAGRVATALQGVTLPEVVPYRVRELALVRSQLARAGAVYTRLAVASFGTEGSPESAVAR